ncbi:MAG: cyclopropane fatty acyl phospholipid synthase [Thermoguttaceae bacterium]
MASNDLRTKAESLLAIADVRVDGGRPWDIQVHNDGVFRRVLAEGSLGLGESYMDGWWDCRWLDEFFHRIWLARLDTRVRPRSRLVDMLRAKLFNLQSASRAFQIGRRHYDIGNDLFQRMLGERLIYSCGYWEHASTLDEAQEAKLDLIGRKLLLRPGMRVLDIGCGWGGTAQFLAERYRVDVVGVTVSQEQARYAQGLCRSLPVEIRLQDYRSIQGQFDRIVSVGMFEHVGVKNYATFLRTALRHLKDDGLFLLHTIGDNTSSNGTDPWILRYIFPNSVLPSPVQICAALEGLFVLEDWHTFGADYDRTLLAWFDNFDRSWPSLKADYDERFYRMWKYYLLSCAGAFRARQIQVWQIVLSPNGVPNGYRAAQRDGQQEPQPAEQRTGYNSAS